jgi:XRE family transcriptional regulator, fatty acid utilization regulator
MGDIRLGPRIKALREAAELSQEQMAKLLEVGSHQIVSQIETGERRLKADELLKIVGAFNVPLEVLTNPFLITGEGRFSWRQKDVPAATLDSYERRAGEWIGAYRSLRQENGERFPALQKRLPLEKTSNFEDAAQAAEALALEFNLGDAPAVRLPQVVEEDLGILVLMVDAEKGISGAACQLPELGAALINRQEPRGRRSFDLAHELFHILTWHAMPPERLDGETPKNKRVEQLADNFAAALLAPSRILDAMGAPGDDLAAWLNEAAGKLQMSAQALKWRMANAGRISRQAAMEVNDAELRFNGEAGAKLSPPPPLFSKAFVSTLAAGIEHGHISARRAAQLTDLDAEDLGDLCDAHGAPRPAEL